MVFYTTPYYEDTGDSMVEPVKNLMKDVEDLGAVLRRKETVADAVNSIIMRHKNSIRSMFQGGILRR